MLTLLKPRYLYQNKEKSVKQLIGLESPFYAL